ncbi:MAG: hypothetical protein Q7T10_18600 [Rhodoferax sp.]|uniref:PilN domain-containing protein n=1 Tax=Rhodoferax sp. TaxID=50421 RepID=UPI002728357D|nr:PilN domain-containing protein [Rhodoferax sp.]MDO8450806.1 hypothetical protein [Rhodoferax sp.]
MHALNINFVRRRRLVSPLGLLLLAAGIVAAGAVAVDYFEARTELERVEARQARLVRADAAPRKRETVSPKVSDDSKAIGRVVSQLRLPWDAVLRETEMMTDSSVALLSLEGQGQTRKLRLTGEAKAMADVVAYVSRLRESRLIDAAYLSHHEERQAGAVRVIRFSVDATWRVPL